MRFYTVFLLTVFAAGRLHGQALYYPPLTGNTWATTDPVSLGWCPDKIDSLYTFLAAKNTRAFLLLKDGKIVLEKYFGSFTADSFHAWASAGKTLVGFTAGVAQREGLININNPTATYLGAGWTSEPPAKEGLITVRSQLTMTTGLDDGVANDDCTLPGCLTYKADAGTRWAYHNAAYTLVQRVVDSAAGVATWQQYFNTRISAKTGIAGQWVSTNAYNSVFFSRPRSAARFGLLMLGRGVWNGDSVLRDTAYFGAMTRPSQALNPAYGYLTWLNGSTTYRLPGPQILFSGPLIPAAPSDLYAALGKDDQKIHVVPSQRLVVVRMGEAADSAKQGPSAFDNALWIKLNAVMCATAGIRSEVAGGPAWTITYAAGEGELAVSNIDTKTSGMRLYDLQGRLLQTAVASGGTARFSVAGLPAGGYVVSDGILGKFFQKY